MDQGKPWTATVPAPTAQEALGSQSHQTHDSGSGKILESGFSVVLAFQASGTENPFCQFIPNRVP